MGINDPNLPIGDLTSDEQALVNSCLTILNKKTSLTPEQQEKFKKRAVGAIRHTDPITEMYQVLVETIQETFGKEDLIKNIAKLEEHVKEYLGENSEFQLLLSGYIKKKKTTP